MSIVNNSIIRSNLNLNSISGSIGATRRSISDANNSVDRISKNVSYNTRTRQELFNRSMILQSRRIEASKRREVEDQIESSKVSTDPKRGLLFSSKSEKGPFGRLMSFLGFMTAGWMVENLPTWTFMGEEFISRIYKFGNYVPMMIQDFMYTIKDFGSVLSKSLSAIVRLDFKEFSEGSVRDSFEDLKVSIENLGNDITSAFGLFKEPLTTSLDTGEQAPGLGDIRPDSIPGTTDISGVGVQKGISVAQKLIREQGFSKGAAAGIIGNILQESDEFRADTEYGGGIGRGWIQWTGQRRANFERWVKKNRLNPKSDDANYGYLLYEMTGNDGNHWTPGYSYNEFKSIKDPKEATEYFMRGYERPGIPHFQTRLTYSQQVYLQLQRNNSQENQQIRQQPQTPLITNFAPVSGTSGNSMGNVPVSFPYSPLKPGSDGVITSIMGMRGGRLHTGYDIAAKTGTPLYAYLPGRVTHVNATDEYGKGYGYWVIWKDDVYGSYHFFGHLQKPPSVSVGQAIKQGALVGYVGSTGRSTGPHLHWEISNQAPDAIGNFTSRVNIGDWLRSHPLKKIDGSQAQITPPPKPQPPQPPSQQSTQNVVIIDDSTSTPPPMIQSAPSQQSYTSTISEFKLLNNFIKNKLLLDLAYL
jgi:hypothetical protein